MEFLSTIYHHITKGLSTAVKTCADLSTTLFYLHLRDRLLDVTINSTCEIPSPTGSGAYYAEVSHKDQNMESEVSNKKEVGNYISFVSI